MTELSRIGRLGYRAGMKLALGTLCATLLSSYGCAGEPAPPMPDYTAREAEHLKLPVRDDGPLPTFEITREVAPLRDHAGGRIKTSLTKGARMKISARATWYRVALEARKKRVLGWIHADSVREEGDDGVLTVDAERGTIYESVRGRRSRRVVENGTRLTVKERAEWLRVESGSIPGWILAAHGRITGGPAPSGRTRQFSAPIPQYVAVTFNSARQPALVDKWRRLGKMKSARFTFFVGASSLMTADRLDDLMTKEGRLDPPLAKDEWKRVLERAAKGNAIAAERTEALRSAQEAGHEIASHGLAFGLNALRAKWDEATWGRALGAVAEIHRATEVSLPAPVGYRAYGLHLLSNGLLALAEGGIQYDASTTSRRPAWPSWSPRGRVWRVPVSGDGPKLFVHDQLRGKAAAIADRLSKAVEQEKALPDGGRRPVVVVGDLAKPRVEEGLRIFVERHCEKDVQCVTLETIVDWLSDEEHQARANVAGPLAADDPSSARPIELSPVCVEGALEVHPAGERGLTVESLVVTLDGARREPDPAGRFSLPTGTTKHAKLTLQALDARGDAIPSAPNGPLLLSQIPGDCGATQ